MTIPLAYGSLRVALFLTTVHTLQTTSYQQRHLTSKKRGSPCRPQSHPLYDPLSINTIPKKGKSSPSNELCPANQTDVDLWIDKCRRLITQKPTFTHPDYHTHMHWSQTFPFQQFHALFNSLFKVLFIFPSRYLFAIGLLPIFSLGRNLPPNSSCNPKQLYSLQHLYTWLNHPGSKTGFSPSMIPYSKGFITRFQPNKWLHSTTLP